MVRIHPEEPHQGLLVKVGERIAAGADEEELNQWKVCILSASGRYIWAPTFDDQYFWVTNARRRFGDSAKMVLHVASQICCDIWMFKTRKDALMNQVLSPKEVSMLYAEKTPDASTDEEARSAADSRS